MPQSLHDIKIDPRNADILISINGTLYPRDKAMVSVFDSGFILGDGVWEGLRLVDGGVPFLYAHVERLYEGAKAIFMDVGISPEELVKRLFACIDANKMRDGVHIRLMVTRGVKATPYQDPRVTISPATIVIIPEYKTPSPEKFERGMTLHTVNVRRGAPDVQDQKLNSHSKLNCITACVQAMNAGADEALMLDPLGFVATCNSTHFFIVRRGEVWTSSGQYCIPGITRGNMIRLCKDNGIPVFEKQFSLYDVYGADEAFVTGTFAGLIPVREIDGRPVRHPMSTGEWKGAGPISQQLSGLYKALCVREKTRSLDGAGIPGCLPADRTHPRSEHGLACPARRLARTPGSTCRRCRCGPGFERSGNGGGPGRFNPDRHNSVAVPRLCAGPDRFICSTSPGIPGAIRRRRRTRNLTNRFCAISAKGF